MKNIVLIFVLVLLGACTLKYGDKEISIMQMQLRDGSASIYTTKLFGFDTKIPLANIGVIQLTLGYVGETKGIIPSKADGSLPDTCIDITNESDNNVFSDTFSTGETSKQIYPKED